MANMQTVRKKREQGFYDCGWEILNGLGSGHWKGGGSWNKALKPLMGYLAKPEGAKNPQKTPQSSGLIAEWAKQQGFEKWAEDHAAVLRNLEAWLTHKNS